MTTTFPQQTPFDNAVTKISDVKVVSSSGLQLQSWRVSPQNVTYQNHAFHTLSVYLKGGYNSYRTDRSSSRGAPNKLCLMPLDAKSEWAVRDDIHFLHLYVPHSAVEKFTAINFFRDIRGVDLQDIDYADNYHLITIIKAYKTLLSSRMAFLTCEQLENDLLNLLLMNYTTLRVDNRIIGGLSPNNLKSIGEYIDDNIATKLTIEGMASHLNLSPFHFAKMFKVSFGISPAQYVLQKRIMKALDYLRLGVLPCDSSIHSGFTHQSHMTAVFTRAFGMTPKQIQQEIKPKTVYA